MNQQELFPTTASKPCQTRTATGPACKRKFLSGGEYRICGHTKADHAKLGDPQWDLESLELSEVCGELRAYFVLRLPFRQFCRYATTTHCLLCGCPEFKSREFVNPFLPGNADQPRRVNGKTMCGNCRHAKRDHYRTGCACGCKKFVNPFVKPQETQPELFPLATIEETS